MGINLKLFDKNLFKQVIKQLIIIRKTDFRLFEKITPKSNGKSTY